MCTGADRGFTLIEAAVALAILGVAVLGLLHAGGQAMRTQAAAERQLEAVTVAEWKMSEIAALPPDSLRPHTAPAAGELWVGPRRYAWRVEVRPEGGSISLWHARVVVRGTAALYTLETLLRRRPGLRGPGGR